jgi:nucleoid DNA-binding protein
MRRPTPPTRPPKNRLEIIQHMAYTYKMGRYETQCMMRWFDKQVIATIVATGHYEIRGFGTFMIVRRAKRKARNPLTNTPILVPECYQITFRPSYRWKKLLNPPKKKS